MSEKRSASKIFIEKSHWIDFAVPTGAALPRASLVKGDFS